MICMIYIQYTVYTLHKNNKSAVILGSGYSCAKIASIKYFKVWTDILIEILVSPIIFSKAFIRKWKNVKKNINLYKKGTRGIQMYAPEDFKQHGHTID